MASSIAEQSKLLNTVAILGTTGTLSIDSVAIPSANSYPWLLPENLILDQITTDEINIKMLTWNGQDIALYNLTDLAEGDANILVIESVVDAYRLGLIYQGNIEKHAVKLADIRDAKSNHEFPYMAASVQLKGRNYLIPELDKLSHELIDLDH